MKSNYKCNKTGKEIYFSRVRTKIVNGKRKYFDEKWKPLDITKIGSIQSPSVFTPTKNRI